jgi:nascent polypeptide-associated complex subunit alpha
MRINQHQLEKMAQRMGMNMAQIEAEEVIIRSHEREIVISEPQVARINMMGQDTFQVSGRISERSRNVISESDVRLVMDQARVSREEAEASLRETGDIAESIMKLKK